ncbi:hypothetical protein B0O80DRAFT_484960 [Mortierella sp. GBAus27b]|nr:hypothetical protein BGX31_005466 [Mortierella sp. GBA43]KAI8358912.1 hypothetical protein B0O80DRAFT_484960 [Mortierella sp. GBAus27b]
MDMIQSFRLSGSTDIVNIPCFDDDGQNVIYWDDVQHVFPEVQYVKSGDVAVVRLRDSINKPHRIRHYPGMVLDIVLSNSISRPSTNSIRARRSTDTIYERAVWERSQASSPSTDISMIDDNASIISITSTLSPTTPTFEFREDSKASMSFKQVVRRAQRMALESEIEKRLLSCLPADVRTQVLASSNVHSSIVQAIKDGHVDRLSEQLILCLQELKDAMDNNTDMAVSMYKLQVAFDAKQDEIKQLQIQALDRLSTLHNNVKALMTQTYELHEYPIPRLFVVLPQQSTSWNPKDLVSTKFRLYFLCECGEHTVPPGSKVSHHIHLAKHEGYEINRPNEFFKRYGSYALTILKMLKYGITMAGVAIPALSLLARTDSLDQAATSLKLLVGDIHAGMDHAIACIEKVTENGGETPGFNSEQPQSNGTLGSAGLQSSEASGGPGLQGSKALEGASLQSNEALKGADLQSNEALEGADLRKLQSFLRHKDESKVLGNLYRIVTDEGHVKWVCIDHFRVNYHVKSVEAFRETVRLMKGTIDENIGRVTIRLRSRIQAEQFYQALAGAKAVYDLEIILDWDTTHNDLARLRDTLHLTSIGALRLDLKYQVGPTSDILNRIRRHDPIFDIMRHPSIHSVAIVGAPAGLVERSTLRFRNDEYSNLKRLYLDLSQLREDISGIKLLVSKMPNLSELVLDDAGEEIAQIHSAIAKYQKYPITFDNLLCIEPPSIDLKRIAYKDDPEDTAVTTATTTTCIADMLFVYGERIEILESGKIGPDNADFVLKSSANGSGLKRLKVSDTNKELRETCIRNLSSIASRSELDKVDIHLGDEEGRVQILKSVQWKNVRKLCISIKEERVGTCAMRALVNEVGNMSQLEVFAFKSSAGQTSAELAELLRVFVASTSLKELSLCVRMSFDQTMALIASANLSKLQGLKLFGQYGFNSIQMDKVLAGLQKASNTREIQPYLYVPTQMQALTMG